jgi:hypothetical protein
MLSRGITFSRDLLGIARDLGETRDLLGSHVIGYDTCFVEKRLFSNISFLIKNVFLFPESHGKLIPSGNPSGDPSLGITGNPKIEIQDLRIILTQQKHHYGHNVYALLVKRLLRYSC